MKPYICNDPIKHDGEDYAVGASIDLDDEAAAPLFAVGAITLDAAALLAANSKADKPEAPTAAVRKPRESVSADTVKSEE